MNGARSPSKKKGLVGVPTKVEMPMCEDDNDANSLKHKYRSKTTQTSVIF